MTDATGHCLMCGAPIGKRRNDGKPQLWCDGHCRRRFLIALKRWALAEIAAGRLAPDGIRAAWAGAVAENPRLARLEAPPPPLGPRRRRDGAIGPPWRPAEAAAAE